MSKESKIILMVTALIAVGIVILVMFVNSSGTDPAAISEKLVRENSRTTGTGQVQLVEFGDYQCPACAQVNPDIELLKEEYEGKITFVYRHFPLPGHPNSQAAAEAAEAAGAQEKFWEMHSKLFETQAQWSALADPTSVFVSYARELELDTVRFEEAIKNKASKEQISNDQTDGYAVGVSGTPTFFINGKRQNQIDIDSLKSAIDAELK